jgi:hypothetical protein
MEPVPNREFLLDYINMNNYNNHNILNNNNILNLNIYRNHLNNNLIYMNYGFQAAAEEAIASVAVAIESVASASSTFKKFNIDVVVVDTTLPSESSESSASSHVCQEKDTCCSICLVCLDVEQEEEKEIVEIVRTKCGHVFHSKCLAKWVPHNTTCPMCRQSIIKKSIIKKSIIKK